MEKSFKYAKEQTQKILDKKEREKENYLSAVKMMIQIKMQEQHMKIIEEELVVKLEQMDKDYNNMMNEEEKKQFRDEYTENRLKELKKG